ncbi:hypothetical protein NGB24_07850 [Mammaliicoccus vitulinus]|uniref:hypothetical protein n=1 Tax=Mammaliicoccus vitulinus TaxID=71237 RepID=UPI002DB725F1|nr:hypothetical protein [Mammaliicoccus vitulinus]MEB7657769.1 hypothetical protein [Mammaliicoccus vitulinus]
MKLSECFDEKFVAKDGDFEIFGLCLTKLNNTLTFIDEEKYVNEVNNNKNIKSIICTEYIFSKIKRNDIGIVIDQYPRYTFFKLHNKLNNSKYQNNFISNSAKISEKAIIGDYNIYIGDNVIVKDFAIIKENTIINKNAIINEGCIIGNDGFEYKKHNEGILKVNHYGNVVIEENVEIKEYVTIHKSLFPWDSTKIGKNSKIDAHTHIAHGTKIGRNVLIGSNSNIAGNVNIGNDVFIGPSATVTNRIKIEHNCKVTLGAVVTRNLESNQTVSGNFAIEHENYVKHIKTIRNG